MEFLKWVLIVGGIGAALWMFDRLFLFCEARGWIYWRKKKASPGTLGSALLELHSIIEPDKKRMAEQLQQRQFEFDENGEPIIPALNEKVTNKN